MRVKFRLIHILLLICTFLIATACSNTGNNVDSTPAYDMSLNTMTDEKPVETSSTAVTATQTESSAEAFDYPAAIPQTMPDYAATEESYAEIPKGVEIGMPVMLALQIPGVKQTVSAIMTGGKITGTVVLQHKGKSYYTNVDFAEEGEFAFGTRCTTPEQVAAFIELACSEQLTPKDFSPEAIVTEQIK